MPRKQPRPFSRRSRELFVNSCLAMGGYAPVLAILCPILVVLQAVQGNLDLNGIATLLFSSVVSAGIAFVVIEWALCPRKLTHRD